METVPWTGHHSRPLDGGGLDQSCDLGKCLLFSEHLVCHMRRRIVPPCRVVFKLSYHLMFRNVLIILAHLFFHMNFEISLSGYIYYFLYAYVCILVACFRYFIYA